MVVEGEAEVVVEEEVVEGEVVEGEVESREVRVSESVIGVGVGEESV